MKDYKLMAVGQIVADCFDYAKVFNKYGIDFAVMEMFPWLMLAGNGDRRRLFA